MAPFYNFCLFELANFEFPSCANSSSRGSTRTSGIRGCQSTGLGVAAPNRIKRHGRQAFRSEPGRLASAGRRNGEFESLDRDGAKRCLLQVVRKRAGCRWSRHSPLRPQGSAGPPAAPVAVQQAVRETLDVLPAEQPFEPLNSVDGSRHD